jgi:small-conductance mechanosensitive channel
MFDFTSQLDDLFLAIYVNVASHLRDELFTSAILLAVLLLIFTLHRKLTSRILGRDWKYKRYASFLVVLIFPLLFLLIVKYSAGHLKGVVSLVVFTSVAYFYLGYNLIKSLLEPLRIGFVPWSLFSYLLLILTCAFLMLIDLNSIILKSPEIEQAFYLIYKVSLILLIYVFLLSALRVLSGLVPEQRELAKSIISSLLGFISVLYLIVAALWLFNIIGFASSVFVGGVVIFITIVVYGFLKTYADGYLKPKAELDSQNYAGFARSVDTLLNFLLIYILYLIFIKFYNLGHLISYLQELFIINTGVIRVSVFSIISAVFMFIFLFSLVGVIKHASYFYITKTGNLLQAGSFRSLMGNLGLLIVIMIALSELGLTWTALLPVAGALGLGIGIGLQDIMKNYISGIIILFSKRLKVGDVIEIEGNAGRAIGNTLETIYGSVVSIDTFSSVITTTDSIEIVVPNAQFIEHQMVNYSLSDHRIRVRIPFGVSYGSDPIQVKEILLKAAGENSQILPNPAPNVWFTEYADSAIVFYLLCWVNIRQLWKINPVISDIYFKAWYEFKQAGVVIPFPQQDVWFKNNLKVEIERDIAESTQKKTDLEEDK